ncbi:MAG: caspase family protein [Nitrospirae bacterium]|nr:MAG: caspase family protein [Nitrospirota bacterium]
MTDGLLGFLLLALTGMVPWAGEARAAEEFIEGNYWALIIGIDKYSALAEDKQLQSARKDAEAVAVVLRNRYGFAQERMIELYDEAATRKAVFKAFSNLRRELTGKDSLFVYFAGHGAYEGRIEKHNEIGFWMLADSEEPSIDPSSSIQNTQIRDFFVGYPARHIFLVSDAFFSAKLVGKTSALVRGKDAARMLYKDKSRWVLTSGKSFPEPDLADKSKKGHSVFAWHLVKLLEANTAPYLLGADIVELLAVRVSNEKQGKLPRSAPIIAAGDEGGQFVFQLLPEFRKDDEAEKARLEAEKGAEKAKAAARDKVRLDTEKAKVDAAQKELEELERELKKAEEALKKGK